MKSTLLVAALLFCLPLFAQDSVFNIKNYKFRTAGFRALSVNLNLSGTMNESSGGDQKNFSLAPSGLTYTRIVSTDKRLHKSSISLNGAVYHQQNSSDVRTLKLRNAQAGLNWNRSDRFYRKSLWFFEVGNDLSLQHSGGSSTDTNYYSKYRNRQLKNTVTIGLGKGRVERVQDAQMALFILNDLSKQGLLRNGFTSGQAYALSTLITDINNRRVFDFRRRRIYELTRLDSFLQASGLTGKTDIRHFTTLNDNWAFAINPFRLSGANWYVRLQPQAGYVRSNSSLGKTTVTDRGKSEGQFVSISPVAGYERYVAKSLKWQHNHGVSLSYRNGRSWLDNTYTQNGISNGSSISAGQNTWTANAFYELGFFPNNRTQLSTALNIQATRYVERVGITDYIQPTLHIGVNYFLGYRTYLSANFYAAYSDSRYKLGSRWYASDHNFSGSFSLAFTHAIF